MFLIEPPVSSCYVSKFVGELLLGESVTDIMEQEYIL